MRSPRTKAVVAALALLTLAAVAFSIAHAKLEEQVNRAGGGKRWLGQT